MVDRCWKVKNRFSTARTYHWSSSACAIESSAPPIFLFSLLLFSSTTVCFRLHHRLRSYEASHENGEIIIRKLHTERFFLPWSFTMFFFTWEIAELTGRKIRKKKTKLKRKIVSAHRDHEWESNEAQCQGAINVVATFNRFPLRKNALALCYKRRRLRGHTLKVLTISHQIIHMNPLSSETHNLFGSRWQSTSWEN